MKQNILNLLALADGRELSGVAISDRLGISRVAVWKHIQGLIQEGYAIGSSSRGYLLEDGPDLPLPCRLQDCPGRVHYFPVLTSTMDRARQMARENAPHLSVIVAGLQTQGRGRLNRSWLSDRGGLWFTVIARPDLPPPLAFHVNFAASLCLADTLNDLTGIHASVKWPNDILAGSKKLAGLLSEMETRGDMLSFVAIGIGLNVNNDPETSQPGAVSLKNLVGHPVSRITILSRFLRALDLTLTDMDLPGVIRRWKQRTSTLGRQVRIETPGAVSEGLAVDVDETGALILQQQDGSRRRVIYGDCFHGGLPPGPAGDP
jgi:BirA family biotin operon repressor/biotin-[acetyl-CoA-carboxylase] ligase